MKICMFVTNPISQDARVKREAAFLAQAGHEVTVLGTPGTGLPFTEQWRGVRFIRVGRLGHRLDSVLRRLAAVFPGSSARDESKVNGENRHTSGGDGNRGIRGQIRDLTWHVHLRMAALRQALVWVTAGLALKADVFHCHDLDTLLYGWLCSRMGSGRLVYDSHELYVDWFQALGANPATVQWLRAIESHCARDASLVITVSDGIADEMAGLYGIDRPLVVRNCDELKPKTERTNRLRTLFGGDSDMPVVLYQGGLNRHRGLEEAIRAADNVPQADFVFMGPHSEFKGRLLETASRAKYRNVHILDAVPQDDLWEYTVGADIGLILTEPFCRSYALSESNKLYQYLAAGLPIVASPIASHERVARETGALLVARSGSADEVARCVKILVAHGDKRKELGRRGRVWARRKYNAERELDKMLTAYEALA